MGHAGENACIYTSTILNLQTLHDVCAKSPVFREKWMKNEVFRLRPTRNGQNAKVIGISSLSPFLEDYL